ncbi:hypothetical protein TNCV_2380871 [Trichonephila clavipes]|nr:hypothetical protein TNCV_2380871 [Trichonephila clavipes]
MVNFSDFQIVGVHLDEASVTETFQLLRVYRDTVSKVMAAYTQRGKTCSANKNSGQKEKLNERDRRVLKQIVMSKKQITATKVTTDLNQWLVSMITVRRHLHKQNIYIRAVTTCHRYYAKRRLQGCHTHLID